MACASACAAYVWLKEHFTFDVEVRSLGQLLRLHRMLAQPV